MENKSRVLKNVYLSYIFSILGDWVNQFALLSIVYLETKSTLFIGLVLISSALPALLFGPLIGKLIDTRSKRSLLLSTDLLRIFLVLGFIVALKYNIYFIFVINFFLSILDSIHNNTRNSLIPNIVTKEKLKKVNLRFSITRSLMTSMGALLGTVLAIYVSKNLAFLLNSISFIISFAIIWNTPFSIVQNKGTRISFVESVKDGFSIIMENHILKGVIITGFGWSILSGVYYILLSYFGAGKYEVGTSGIGILYSVQGFGSIAGGALLILFLMRQKSNVLILFSVAKMFQCFIFVAFLFSSNIFLASISIFSMRIIGGILVPLDTSFIQENTPKEYLGRVFTFRNSIVEFMMQLSMFLFAILSELVKIQTLALVFTILSGSIILFGVVVLLLKVKPR